MKVEIHERKSEKSEKYYDLFDFIYFDTTQSIGRIVCTSGSDVSPFDKCFT